MKTPVTLRGFLQTAVVCIVFLGPCIASIVLGYLLFSEVYKPRTFYHDGHAMTCLTDWDGKQIAIIGTGFICASALWYCLPDVTIRILRTSRLLVRFGLKQLGICLCDIGLWAFASRTRVICAIVVGIMSIVSIPIMIEMLK